MNKLLTRIAKGLLGLSMAVGVGVVFASKEVEKVSASNYELTPYTIANTTNPANYSQSYTDATVGVTCNGVGWHFEGNTSLTAAPLWRIGGKANNSGDRSIYNTDPISIAVEKINYTRSGYKNGSGSSITLNSITLTVASDADFTDVLDTVSISSPTITGSGVYEFSPTISAGYWESGSYYRFVLSLTLTGTNNSYIGFGGLEFVQHSGGDPVETQTVSYYSDDVLYTSQEVYLPIVLY